MQHLLTQWSNLIKKIKNNFCCIFLDFDGTLTKITKTPQLAVLSNETKSILQLLTKSPRCQIVIVSGRTLKNIKSLIGIKGIIYAGNHGMEFGSLHTEMTIPVTKRYKIILKKIKTELIQKLDKIKGILIEDKKFSLTLHYRLAKPKYISLIKTIFNRIISKYKQDELLIIRGKKVLEITPSITWHKGKIVLLVLVLLHTVLKKHKIIPIYIGDDKTDENAFMALKKTGITVFVGKPKTTQANYYLKNTQEVKIFLKQFNSFLVKISK